jgi:hypothetical protein
MRPAYLRNNPAVPARTRFRLYEYRQPAESFSVYLDNYLSQAYQGTVAAGSAAPTLQYQPAGSVKKQFARQWYSNDLSTYSRVLADNIIALIISPRSPGISDKNGAQQPDFAHAPAYLYDSRGLLCGVQTNIIVSGESAGGAAQAGGAPPPPPSVAAVTTNVLPPVLDITMVALDEASAARYAAGKSASTPLVLAAANSGSGSAGLFQTVSSKGTSVSTGDIDDQFEADLATLETYLTSQHLNYEVFRTSVAVRAAKFSTK